MKTFAIKDTHHKRRKPEAWLMYDESTEKFSALIDQNADSKRLPIILGTLFEQGHTTIDDYWARKFVKERIVPSERQNIGAVLKAVGLTEYKEIDMLKLSMGHCSQDDFYLEETDAIDLPKNKIAYSILEARKKQHLTQAELSKRSGIKQSNLSRIENGVCDPSINTLQQIASGLGLSLKVSFE